MRKLIFTALFAAMLFSASAQDFNQTEAIKNQLGDMENTQLNDAESQLDKADKIMESCAIKQAQADKLKSQMASLSKGKAKKIQKQIDAIETPLIAQKINAYNIYEKANAATYGIYAANLKELKDQANSEKKNAASNLINEATQSWTQATASLKKVPTGKKVDPKQVLKIKEEAKRQEDEAISQQIQAYSILLGWFDKKEDEKVATTTITKTEEEIPEVEKTDRIIFKVQIAASNQPLELSTLKTIYKSKEIISNELDDGVYRYSVGYYLTHEEALEAIKRMGVKGAFVVGYKNGKRVKDINEVLNN